MKIGFLTKTFCCRSLQVSKFPPLRSPSLSLTPTPRTPLNEVQKHFVLPAQIVTYLCSFLFVSIFHFILLEILFTLPSRCAWIRDTWHHSNLRRVYSTCLHSIITCIVTKSWQYCRSAPNSLILRPRFYTWNSRSYPSRFVDAQQCLWNFLVIGQAYTFTFLVSGTATDRVKPVCCSKLIVTCFNQLMVFSKVYCWNCMSL
jgi:hypothetical protein